MKTQLAQNVRERLAIISDDITKMDGFFNSPDDITKIVGQSCVPCKPLCCPPTLLTLPLKIRVPPANATHLYIIIGERERANLVVQLARFFYIYICRTVVCRTVGRIYFYELARFFYLPYGRLPVGRIYFYELARFSICRTSLRHFYERI